MSKAFMWLKNGLALAAMLCLGFWLGSGRPVHAYDDGSGQGVQFQLVGGNLADSLLVYQPTTKTIYVYRSATQGNDALQCSYKFQMEGPGAVIRRIPCAMQHLNP